VIIAAAIVIIGWSYSLKYNFNKINAEMGENVNVSADEAAAEMQKMFDGVNAVIKESNDAAIDAKIDKLIAEQAEQPTVAEPAMPKVELIQQTPLPNVDPATVIQILNWEKDLFGVYLTDHPLTQISDFFMSAGAISIKDAKDRLPTEQILIGAQIQRMKKLNTNWILLNMRIIK